MRRLIVFNNVTLDGYFAGEGGDISWAKGHADPEFNRFVTENAIAGGELLFGRITYELMAGYWPTSHARESDPVVAERMNALPKVVFSRTLAEAGWGNTRLVKDDLVGEVRRMKGEDGRGIAILGSGSLVAQLASAGLVDEFQFVVNPVVIGRGRTMFEGIVGFEGIGRSLEMKLVKTRAFGNGNVVLWYEPAGKGA